MRSTFIKEWRVHIAFVAGLVLIGIVGFVLFIVVDRMETKTPAPVDRRGVDAWMVLIVVGTGLIFGATSFAEEREHKTFGLLERLPVTPRELWLAKALFAWSAALAVFVILAAVQIGLVAGGWVREPKMIELDQLLRVSISVGLLGWAAGALVSPGFRQVMAACVSATAVACIVELVVVELGRGWDSAIRGVIHRPPQTQVLDAPWAVVGLRVLFAGCIGMFARHRIGANRLSLTFRLWTRAQRAAKPKRRPVRGSFVALLWKEYRANRKLWLIVFGSGALVVTCACVWVNESSAWTFGPYAGILAVAVIASASFSAERTGKVDVLLQRVAVSPGQFWLAKLLTAGLVSAWCFQVLTLVSLGCCLVMRNDATGLIRDEQMNVLRIIAAFVAISCFLMASTVRKPIMAMLAGMVLGAMALAFYFVTGLPYVTFLPDPNYVLCVPASFLLAGLLNTQAWIGPKPSRRRWIPLLPIALSIVPFSIGFYWTNWGGVAEVEPPFDVDEFINAAGVPESENGRRVYLQAIDALPDLGRALVEMKRSEQQRQIFQAYEQIFLSDVEKTWADDEASAELYLNACAKSLELSRQATDMKHAELWPRTTAEVDAYSEFSEMRDLAEVMVLKARQLHHQGKSPEAAEWLLDVMRMARHVEYRGGMMQSYLAMAIDALATEPMVRILNAPEWTSVGLRAVLKDFQAIERIRFPVEDVVKIGYVGTLGWYEFSSQPEVWDAAAEFVEVPPIGSYGLTVVARIEERKTLSATNAVYRMIFDAIARANSEGRPIVFSDEEVARGAELLERSLAGRFLGPRILSFSGYFEARRRRQVRLSLTKTAIALTVWKMEHGRWPDSLEDLVPDVLPDLPMDAYAEPAAPLLYRQIPSAGISYVDEDGTAYDSQAPAHERDDFSSEFEVRIDKDVAHAAPKIQMLYSRGKDGKDDGGYFMDNYGSATGDWLVLLPGESLLPRAPHRSFPSGYDSEF